MNSFEGLHTYICFVFLEAALLWYNPNYIDSAKLKGFQEWRRKGMHFIGQLYIGVTFKSFEQLPSEF